MIPNERPRHLTLVANPSPNQLVENPRRRHSVEPLVLRFPELAPVLSRAMSAVIDALEFGERTPPNLICELERAAATAMTAAYEPIADAASRLARSTEASRATEAARVRRRAEETAALVAETAIALQQRHDHLAKRAAEEATTAARILAAATVPGHKLEAKKHALQQANTVRDAAARRADQWAAAAVLTAEAADQAAARVAVEAEQAAVIVERDALEAAAAVQATALDVMYGIALDSACRHFLVPSPGPDDPHAS